MNLNFNRSVLGASLLSLSISLCLLLCNAKDSPSLFESNVEALTEIENYPDKTKPIWNVTYHNSGSQNQTIDCSTGGHYCCPES